MLCSRSVSFIATTLVSADSTAAITRATWRPPLYLMLSRALIPATIAATSGPNSRLSAGERVRGVFHRVVQYRRAQGPVVRAEPGEDRRDGHRMGDVRVTAAPELAMMAVRRDIVGPPEQVDIGIGPGGPEGLAQRCDRVAAAPRARDE